jgi:cytochrome c peroxidase
VKLELAVQAQDAPLAKDFVKVRDKLTPEQREGVKNKFHVNIKPKGHECKTCHSTQSILDFKRMGFSENRIVDLEQLNVRGMLTKYGEFYLPDLFTEPEQKKTNEKK